MLKKALIAALMAVIAMPAAAQTQAAAQATAPLPDADPAMWVVKDKDTIIYLFGTVHALDGKKAWFNDEVKTAFDQSKEVVFEIKLPDAAKAQAMVMDKAVDRSGKSLTAKLSPERAKKLAAELGAVGTPANALDRFEPWFASTQLAMIRFARKGFTPDKGAEMILKAAAEKDGKTVGEVETMEWQLGLFDALPEDLQLKMLGDTLDEADKSDGIIAAMMDSWTAGDVDKLANVMNEGMAKTPELRKALLTDRNARWAEWIDARLDKPGIVFMAVGAGHLGGKDSVQQFLARKGIKAKRVKS